MDICDYRVVPKPLKVVCLGGGLGAPTVMAGMRAHTEDITGIIAVTDSGRSTGKVRIALDVPAPGDIRNAIAVLAEGDPVLRRLFSHRFETDKSDELNGMAFGNLFLAALAQQEGSFLRAVEEAARILQIRGKVLPVTLYNTDICAKLADGTVVEGEVNVRGEGKARIERIFLRDADVQAAAGTVEAIVAADLITLGPGSLYTTVCACLLVPDIARAISEARGLVVYVANTTSQPGQTDDVTLSGHVAVVRDYLGGTGLDVVLLNDDAPPAHLRDHHAEQGMRYLEPTADEIARIEALGVRAAMAPVIDKWSGPRELWNKQDTIRHDASRLSDALMGLVSAQQPRLRAVR
ncbi:MAG TPA: gluconeogenesis factor YvcK family protein [Candidatus Limnocylindria bacterium]